MLLRLCRVSVRIFGEVDNLFARLSYKANRHEITNLLMKIMPEELSETDGKLNRLHEVIKDLEDLPRYYVLCFAFMIAMEGYYDELVRLVYCVREFISTGIVADPDLLKYEPIDRLYSALRFHSPTIIAIWTHGHHVRNAIAHARFTYDEKKKMMRFIDVIERGKEKGAITFDKSFRFDDVAGLYEAIRTLGEAMRVVVNLWLFFNNLTTPPEKIV